jgi:DsbC/DsbD-like thiol-disulfide interchange protein
LAVALVVAGLAFSQGGGQLNPVKVKIAADKKSADGKEVINITIEIEKNWHIYANPVENDDLTAAQTTVKIEPKGRFKSEVQFPKGTAHKDPAVGTFKAYEGKVTIPVVVQRPMGDTTPLEVSVTYQACDPKKCLVPTTVKKTIP